MKKSISIIGLFSLMMVLTSFTSPETTDISGNSSPRHIADISGNSSPRHIVDISGNSSPRHIADISGNSSPRHR